MVPSLSASAWTENSHPPKAVLKTAGHEYLEARCAFTPLVLLQQSRSQSRVDARIGDCSLGAPGRRSHKSYPAKDQFDSAPMNTSSDIRGHDLQAISLWLVDLADVPFDIAYSFLPAADLARAAKFSRFSDFQCFVKCRGALRFLLGKQVDQLPNRLEIRAGNNGKPELLGYPDRVQFNASHRKDQLLVAISRDPVGVDIEYIDTQLDFLALAPICFHPSEVHFVTAQDHQSQADAFFQIWTHKEAFLKGTGTGLLRDPRTFSVHPDGGWANDQTTHHRWILSKLECPSGYKASLASTKPAVITTYSSVRIAEG